MKNIGQAASTSGMSAKMIRHYEELGLIGPISRSPAGYRHYSDQDLHTLAFIRRARDLGFSVDQIRTLLGLWRDRTRSSAEVKEIALTHVAALQEKAQALQDMADTLRHLAQHCHGDARPDCPILERLAGADSATICH